MGKSTDDKANLKIYLGNIVDEMTLDKGDSFFHVQTGSKFLSQPIPDSTCLVGLWPRSSMRTILFLLFIEFF